MLFLASDESSLHHRQHVPGRRRHLRRLCHPALSRARSARPVIGLTTYREQARWGSGTRARGRAAAPSTPTRSRPPAAYRCCCRRPPDAAEPPAAVVARLDGLVVTGGADVDPGAVRRGAAPRDLVLARGPRRLGAGSASGRGGGRTAGARCVPRDAADGRRRRRRAAPAHPRARRARGAQPRGRHRSAAPGSPPAEGSRGARAAGRGGRASAATTTRCVDVAPGLHAHGVGGRRLARGDGTARPTGSAWPSSGIRRSATTTRLFEALVVAARGGRRSVGPA